MPNLSDFLLVALPAVFLTGISKGGFGGALGGIAVPLLALAMPPKQAAAIMLPILCLTDIVGLKRIFGHWDKDNLKVMLPGALLGTLVGAFAFDRLNDSLIGLLIGFISVAFVAINLAGARFIPSSSPARSAPKGLCLSGVAGFTSFVAHAGGPPVMMYLLPQRLDKTRYLATVNAFFLVTNAVKLMPYALLGQFSGGNLLSSLVLAPMVPIGVAVGLWLHRRVSHVWFYRIAQAGLLLTGVQLVLNNRDVLF